VLPLAHDTNWTMFEYYSSAVTFYGGQEGNPRVPCGIYF